MHTAVYPSFSVLLVLAWSFTTICVIIWGSNPSRNAPCIKTNVFMAEKSCNKMINIFISCVVNLFVFHFSDLPHSLISNWVLNTVLCVWNNVVIIIIFNSAPSTGGGDGGDNGSSAGGSCCYMSAWMLNIQSLLCHRLIFFSWTADKTT